MSFGGFGAKPASSGQGFGAAPAASGGFGSAAGGGFGSAGRGGFGASAPAAAGTGGGFGAASTSGGFGAASAGTTGFGAGRGGFGAGAASGGFGSGTTGGGFGSGTTGGGFGAAATAPAAGGGFGAPAGTGGFNATGGTTGFGAGRGGFGLGGGFNGLGTAGAGAAAAANAAPTAAQYPYPGIKGPGNSMSWAREVDFSQVTEQTPFESLPQPLQQHLMELRSFMHAERDATKKVYDYLNESDRTTSTVGTAADPKGGASGAATASYRGLLAKLAALKGGGNRAVELVAVHCNQHEGQARRQLQRIERLEASVRDYERHVWEPLLEQGLPLSGNGGAATGLRGGLYRPAVNSDAVSPFVSLVEELSRRLDSVSEELSALEATVVPPGRPLRAAGSSERPGHRNGSAVPSDAIAQINASLLYELNQLRDFSCVAAHLHSRTDTARELFTRQYGQAEADVLFTDTEAQRNGMALFRRASPSSYFDIPPLPQQQPAPAASAATAAGGFGAPTAAPAAGGFGSGASTGGFGGFGAKPAAATASATTAAPTTIGFGVASTPAAAATGGFGAKPATTTTPATTGATGGFGFGASASTAAPGAAASAPPSAAPATTGFGAAAAPAGTGGFGAAAAAAPSAPAMGPASPAGAPTSFSLGGSATGTVGFGAGPGKSAAADGEDRPLRRPR